MKEFPVALTFDDVLLKPCYSEITPDKVSIETSMGSRLKLNIPIMSAAMDTVTGQDMALAIAKLGGLGVIHKNMTIDAQAGIVGHIKEVGRELKVGAAIGAVGDYIQRADALIEAGVDALVIDTAHGHSINVRNAVESIRSRSKYDSATLIAGNVATADAAHDLFTWGADVVKVGVGPGAICSTRIVAGVGVPQLTAIIECCDSADDIGGHIIADGGIRYSGDIVKALAAGADCVMIGNLFASATEAPGELKDINGKLYKNYRGMGSICAMKDGSADRYSQNGTTKFVPEGVDGWVECGGSISDIIYQLVGGLKSGMGYLGAKDLGLLRARADFIRITESGFRESHIHNMSHVADSPNYKI